MAAQSLCAKLGIRLAIVGSSASLAFCAPITNAGSDDTTAHTAANRSGVYFDQTAAAEKVGFIVGGQTGPLLTRSGTTVNVAITGIVGLTGATTNCFESTDGSTAALSGGATGRIRYNNTAGAWQVSVQGGAYASISTGSAALTATYVGYGSVGNTLTGDSAFVRSALALTVDPNTDNTFTTGYGKMGQATSGTSTTFHIAQASNYTSLNFALSQNASGLNTILNTKTGGQVFITVNASPIVTTSSTSVTVASGATVIASNVTDGTSGSAGAITTLGGIGVTKAGWFGTTVTVAGLTATRIPFVSTAGLIVDSAALTYTTATSPTLALSAADATVVRMSSTNTTSTAQADILVFNDLGSYSQYVIFGSASVGNYLGTGIAKAGMSLMAANAGHFMVYTGTAGKNVYLSTGDAVRVTVADASVTFASSVTSIHSNTTDGTSGSAGSINTLGGIGATKAVWAGTNLTAANGVLSVTLDDSATNTVTTVSTLSHTTSGTAANAFGVQQLFKLEDDGGTNQNACAINVVWTTAATATRTAGFQFQCVSSAAALGNIFQINPSTVTVSSATFVAGGFSGITISQTAAAGGVRACLAITPATNLTVTSGTEDSQVLFNFNRTQTWATTTPATQREFIINQPTYACNAVTQTITDGATVAIVGAPLAGTNVTITNKHALWVQAGWLTLPGNTTNSLRITSPTSNGSVAVTITSVGPTGAQTTIQGWMIINVSGTDRYMPFW